MKTIAIYLFTSMMPIFVLSCSKAKTVEKSSERVDADANSGLNAAPSNSLPISDQSISARQQNDSVGTIKPFLERTDGEVRKATRERLDSFKSQRAVVVAKTAIATILQDRRASLSIGPELEKQREALLHWKAVSIFKPNGVGMRVSAGEGRGDETILTFENLQTPHERRESTD